jgi:hypothetical protein
MTTEGNVTSWKQERKYLEAVYWGGVLIWAGLVFGVDSLGYLPQIGGADAWSWVFIGAGAYALVGALLRAAGPDYLPPTTWDYVWAGILLILGLSGFTGLEIGFSLILLLIGVALLASALVRRE